MDTILIGRPSVAFYASDRFPDRHYPPQSALPWLTGRLARRGGSG